MTEESQLRLVFVPSYWKVRLVSGEALELRADGFTETETAYVFKLLMEGQPHFEFVCARIPRNVVDDIEGGPNPR